MSEEWKDIPGYEGKYRVSNRGEIVSIHYKRSIKENPQPLVPRESNGYLYVVLSKNNKVKVAKPHRLVAELFIPNPDNKPYVNHKDGNKQNNSVENLEWVTPLENNLHMYHVLKKHPMNGYRWDKSKHSKRVEQYYTSPEGYSYHIATYANSVVAGLINGVCSRRITACCNQKNGARQSGGYVWKYED